MIDEEQHILRYWEKEFPHLKPRKNRGGNRIYSEKDIELIRLIKNMLRVDKLSLKGAKEAILKFLNESENVSLFHEMEKDGFSDLEDFTENNLVESKSKKKTTITFNLNEAEELLNLLKRFSFELSKKN
jgi:DNA-binding transcriptional MerR regulator